MSIQLSVDEMSKAGLQFGHKKSNIHPKMKPYLSGVRNTVFIINLKKTTDLFEAALEATEEAVYNALFQATTVRSAIGTAEAIPVDRVRELLKK